MTTLCKYVNKKSDILQFEEDGILVVVFLANTGSDRPVGEIIIECQIRRENWQTLINWTRMIRFYQIKSE